MKGYINSPYVHTHGCTNWKHIFSHFSRLFSHSDKMSACALSPFCSHPLSLVFCSIWHTRNRAFVRHGKRRKGDRQKVNTPSSSFAIEWGPWNLIAYSHRVLYLDFNCSFHCRACELVFSIYSMYSIMLASPSSPASFIGIWTLELNAAGAGRFGGDKKSGSKFENRKI